MPTDENAYVEYRIESIPPGEEGWRYVRFTGASGRDKIAVLERMKRAVEESPGWQFRVVTRRVHVVTTTTPWEEVRFDG